MKLTIAVISDIHIGTAARSKDLTPATAAEQKRDEKFLEKFAAHIQQTGIKADILLVSGDLTTQALASEFVHASQVISRVAETLDVSKDSTFFVPGNHDVDWSVLKLSKEQTDQQDKNLRWQQRYDPIVRATNARSFRDINNSGNGNLFEPPFANIWRQKNILVVAVNSAWHDQPTEKQHHGMVSAETLTYLQDELSRCAHNANELRLCLIHHHLIPHTEPLPQFVPDFSALQRADELLALLRKHKVDLLVHGHKHVPRFGTHLIDSDHAIHVLGAGSFSAELEAQYSGSVTNQFHIIEIDSRHPKTGRTRGTLRSWAFASGHGWIKSDPVHTGIWHEIGFGAYTSKNELLVEAREYVKRELSRSALVRWRTLKEENCSFRFASPSLVHLVLEELAQELDLEFEDSAPENLFLAKREGQ